MRKRDVVLLVIFLIFAFGLAAYYDQPKDHMVKYDCSMSEISPDVPIKVKELCRQARLNNKPQEKE